MKIGNIILRWPGTAVLLGMIILASGSLLISQEKETKLKSTADETVVDFSRDIRPILSDTCFKCHGPDESTREAGLRLDTREGLLESDIISHGDTENSELFQRIVSDDESDLMPPPDSGRVLTKKQIQLIKKWIDQGAKWGKHWSFEPVKKTTPPVSDRKWGRNEIDAFVLAQMNLAGLSPNEPADRATLCRRLYLDLTGLLPTPEQLDQFLNDPSSDAYEKLVEKLLDSPHYGEHMARYWLDGARYGDTHGLHLDNYREMWLYRDWVVEAFNDNKSYRDFGMEQLAGDLLKNPSDDQLIATGFNRAHVTTNEGGSIKEEVYVRNVIDRVSTAGTVFMGLTVGCASCHDHKFDPISQKEFYQLFAYFNNLDADPMDGNRKDHAPILRVASEEQKIAIAKLEKEVESQKQLLKKVLADYKYSEPTQKDQVDRFEEPREFVWIEDDAPAGAKKQGPWKFARKPKGIVLSGETSTFEQSGGFTQHFFTDAPQPLVVEPDDILFAHVFIPAKNRPKQIMLQFNDGSWEHRAFWGEDLINFGTTGTPGRLRKGDLPESGKWVRLEVPAREVGFTKPARVHGWAFSQFGGKVHWDKSGVVSRKNQNFEMKSLQQWSEISSKAKGAGLPGEIANIFKLPADKRNDAQQTKLREYFLTNIHPESRIVIGKEAAKVKEIEKRLTDTRNRLPTTLIYKERAQPKPAFMLNRGQYDDRGDEVQRKTPKALPPFPKDAPNDRLGFAQWLFSGQHPLTARVAVNRYWQQVFGTGIVKTSEDFGSQGEWPSHPELLDWLADEFVQSGWDIKQLMRLIVTSETYRQSSHVNKLQLAKDPGNRLLSRGPRFRLDAETLRDVALASGNLLVKDVGGPGVKPPQPAGLWFAVGYSGSNTVRFRKDMGHEKVHRRSLYTFWKRTSPPPQMSIADAPSRESCVVRRERTNTPLLALMLMNDPQYVEAARYLGQLTVDQAFSQDEKKIEFMYLRTLQRQPKPQELEIVLTALQKNRSEFKTDPDSAKKLIAIGEKPADQKYEPVELASLTMVANILLNLDEFVTKN